MAKATASTTRSEAYTWPKRSLVGALRSSRAAILAGVATTVVYVVALAAGVPLAVRMIPDLPASQLPLAMVVSTSVLAAIAGSIVRAATRAVFGRRSRAFQIVAVTALLLSIAAPLALGDDVATKVALVLMHISAAVAIVTVLERDEA